MRKIITIAVFAILVWSCRKDCPKPNHEYVFLEVMQYDWAELVVGDGTIAPKPHWDYLCYGYKYDPSNMLITDYCNTININDSLELMIGEGTDPHIHGVYNLPYIAFNEFTFHAGKNIKIETVSDDGLLYYYYGEELKSIKAGEMFEDVYSEIEEWVYDGYDDVGELIKDTTIVEYTYTTRIINHGVFDKSNYTQEEWMP